MAEAGSTARGGRADVGPGGAGDGELTGGARDDHESTGGDDRDERAATGGEARDDGETAGAPPAQTVTAPIPVVRDTTAPPGGVEGSGSSAAAGGAVPDPLASWDLESEPTGGLARWGRARRRTPDIAWLGLAAACGATFGAAALSGRRLRGSVVGAVAALLGTASGMRIWELRD